MRSRLVGLGVVAVLVLGACTSSPARRPLAEARTAYPPVLTSVTGAVTRDLGPTWTAASPAVVAPGSASGTCAYRSERLTTPVYLGRVVPWSEVKKAVDQALSGTGFGPTASVEGDAGGWLVLTATDAYGATLTVRSKGTAEAWIEAVTTGSDCS